MLDALSSPCIDHMDVPISALDDGGIGVLQDGTVLERYPVAPVLSVVAAEDGQRCACPFFLVGLYRPVVADECIGAVGECHCIDATVVVGRLDKGQGTPRLAVVGAARHADMPAACSAEGLQRTVGQYDDGGLDGFHALVGHDEGCPPPCLPHVVA